MQNKRLIIKKDDQFCREVVAHYLLKNNPELMENIQSEVDKWIDYHCSEEFKKSIVEDVFMIYHYGIGLEKMVSDYLSEKECDKNVQ